MELASIMSHQILHCNFAACARVNVYVCIQVKEIRKHLFNPHLLGLLSFIKH